MAQGKRRLLSAASFVETGLKLIVLKRDAFGILDAAIEGYELTLVDVTAEQAREAVRAEPVMAAAPLS